MGVARGLSVVTSGRILPLGECMAIGLGIVAFDAQVPQR